MIRKEAGRVIEMAGKTGVRIGLCLIVLAGLLLVVLAAESEEVDKTLSLWVSHIS